MRYSWQGGSLSAWAGSIPALPPAGRRKKIKLVLKEGHLARETKGLRNPLLWGTFKWGEIPTQASALCRGNMRAATPRRWSPPPLLALFPLFVSYPLNNTWGCLGL